MTSPAHTPLAIDTTRLTSKAFHPTAQRVTPRPIRAPGPAVASRNALLGAASPGSGRGGPTGQLVGPASRSLCPTQAVHCFRATPLRVPWTSQGARRAKRVCGPEVAVHPSGRSSAESLPGSHAQSGRSPALRSRADARARACTCMREAAASLRQLWRELRESKPIDPVPGHSCPTGARTRAAAPWRPPECPTRCEWAPPPPAPGPAARPRSLYSSPAPAGRAAGCGGRTPLWRKNY